MKTYIVYNWYISFINVLCLILIVIGRDSSYDPLLWIAVTLLIINLIIYSIKVLPHLKLKKRNLFSIISPLIFIFFFIYYSLYKLGAFN